MAGSVTLDAWYALYVAHQRGLGMYGTPDTWHRWISPRIGHLQWNKVTPEHVEAIRDDLDAAIVARRELGPGRGRLTPRSACSVWDILRSAVTHARRSKRRDLRVLARGHDPMLDVAPPGERGARRGRIKPWIYPVEFLRLASCTRVPHSWRRLYAIACYTYLRPGELRVLRVSDIDLANNVVRVTKAWHYLLDRVKEPKTAAGYRDVPIDKHLRPLLVRAIRGLRPEDLVAPILSDEPDRSRLSEIFREHLWTAGVRRPALHEQSMLARRAVYRSWRDTGLTWLAVSGVDIVRIQRRAGHQDLRTTSGYVRQAEDLAGKLGTPFPPLPKELLASER